MEYTKGEYAILAAFGLYGLAKSGGETVAFAAGAVGMSLTVGYVVIQGKRSLQHRTGAAE